VVPSVFPEALQTALPDPNGAPILHSNFRSRIWLPAVAKAGLEGLRIHDLRHTAASLAVAAGANVKAVQEMLGHSSAAMTLDRYSGLFDDHLDEVAIRLDDLLSDAERHQNATTGRLPHVLRMSS
jgi:integrase